jgi:hypothetical protein
MPRQRGAALLALLAVLVLGASWFLVSRLDALSTSFTARNRNNNAIVLNRAKQALIGYVAAQAVKAGENNPGSLPCPENPGDFDSITGREGLTGTACGSSLKVGRFPWRTIGTEKLVDASGEPLWYVVSMSWGVPSAGNTSINSNSVGQLTVDGVAGTDNDTVVALIIAPGPAISVAAAAGCTAWTQVRPTTGTPDWRNYLECENATSPPDAIFVTTGPSSSFNDQVMRVTKANIMPGIEAAIANRIEREIAPALKGVYAGTKWNASASSTVYPFAAPFGDPGTSDFRGSALPATPKGLLPFSYSPPCSPAGDARCTSSTFHAWGTPTLSKVSGSGSLYLSPSCSVSGSLITCEGWYQSGSLQASFDDPVSNVANALRDFNLADHTVTVSTNLCASPCPVASPVWDGYQIETSTRSRRFNSNGSLSFVVDTPFRWASGKTWGYYYIQAQRPAITDHALLSASTASSTGWFARNEWYRLAYYAIAPNYAAGGTLSCTTGTTCLSVVNVTPAGAQRAILILAGRSINGTTRPSATLANYLEFGNATGAFERQPVSTAVAAALKKPFNDRIVVVDTN